jgi:hypothetical protein
MSDIKETLELTLDELLLKINVLESTQRHKHVQSLLNDIKYKDWYFMVTPSGLYNVLNIHAPSIVSNRTGERTGLMFTGFIIPDFASDSDIMNIVFRAIMEFEKHEAKEQFYFRDQRIFDPHTSLEKIMDRTFGENMLDYKLPERM